MAEHFERHRRTLSAAHLEMQDSPKTLRKVTQFHTEDGLVVRNFDDSYTFDSPSAHHKKTSVYEKRMSTKPIEMDDSMAEFLGMPKDSKNPHAHITHNPSKPMIKK